ncbi:MULTISPECIES: EAL domain-containing protein [Halomonadaceae]|uniref:EAL domain-containing protein n=1 Tax=Halomonadaceae TaxID=28256 RepID=UPI001581DA79|nr:MULTISPECIES: EAL domain-containing protein [Halomonas]MDI4636783.1 EAL domain-containing protein [Halomonas sp. BMC7]NUJ61145.1 EAL domain-containing protein [Halomonas taeanensis]
MTPASHHAEFPRIAVELANPSNGKLLERLLGQSFCLHHEFLEGHEHPAQEVDLVMVDVASLRRHYDLIRELRRRARPMVLPVLLVAESRGSPHPQLTAELGRSVDDILRIPTSQAELQARINNMLRLRTLAREQDDARRQLVGVVSALRTLSACDSIVVRSDSESELIKALCETVVDEDGYNLAWIGFLAEGSDSVFDIRAWAGPAQEFVADLKQNLDQESPCFDMISQCIRTNTAHIVNDIADTSPRCLLSDRAIKHQLAAAIMLPLKFESGPAGCLTIYSNRADHFDHNECQLLERLAANLVFGLNSLRTHSEREQQAAEIHYLAYTDALTGLPNRRHLIHYLDDIVSAHDTQENDCAILFIDLDGFKRINDALGHEVGDEVLCQLGQRLQASVRDSDLVIRQGGDEFLVVVNAGARDGTAREPATIVDIAHHLADRIIAHVSEPLMVGGYTHHLKASVGISLVPEHGRDATILIENADKAMYEAKRRGGGQSQLFSKDIADSCQQRFSMETRLRRALEEQQFELYYQPIFELASCRIVAAEALIRWPQSDGEVLAPGAFMPLVEELGLIKPLGDWVLETAARQLKAWHDQGLELEMAVNLSINQLYPNSDVEHFSALVTPHVDPSWMHLEVTENALMEDPTEIEALLRALHDQGFQLAIDDFGTGYSSLSRLQHLSLQTLKIDRSFVNELDQPNNKGEALVAIIYQMASSLGLYTIAEGIETSQQRQLLIEMSTGKAWGQGFWFSKPIPAHEFEQLANGQARPLSKGEAFTL